MGYYNRDCLFPIKVVSEAVNQVCLFLWSFMLLFAAGVIWEKASIDGNNTLPIPLLCARANE